MWWLTAKKWFKISAAWCRQHWRWIAIGSVALIMYYLGNKRMKNQLMQARLALQSYESEKEAIERAHEMEVEGIIKAQETYNKALLQIDQRYSNKTEALGKEEAKRIRKMIKKAKSNPDEIDNILENELGIKKI
tara:strand:- start:81 stop:482 length:402 start_codon:yes stop_codon:yes gene_type:complete